MATKKPAAKAASKTAVATRKTGVPVSADLMAKIQADIAEQASMVVPSTTNKIRLNSESGKKFVFPDKSEVAEFEGIVVDFATAQVLYDGAYVPGTFNTILCYAAATKPVDLAPYEGVTQPQAENCKSCTKSKFGPNSEKPECGLRKLLAILPTDADDASDLLILDLPVLAAKAYDKYAQSVLVAEGKPQYAVVTKFSFDQTVKFDSPRFEMIDACDGEQAAAAYARREEARIMLLAAPNFTPVEQPKGKGKSAPLAAPKKRAK